MIASNLLSVFIYAYEYHHTGEVVTTSGQKARGYHELPAIISLVGFLHQLYFRKRSGWHSLIGKISILCTVVLLVATVDNLRSGVLFAFRTNDALRMSDGWPKQAVLVWNEALNIFQFYMYGFILLYLLGKGVESAKSRDYHRHEQYMQGATLFLLGPLHQRFAFNHLTDRQLHYAVPLQVITITVILSTFYISSPVVRLPLKLTIGFSLIMAVFFVRRQSSALEYLLIYA